MDKLKRMKWEIVLAVIGCIILLYGVVEASFSITERDGNAVGQIIRFERKGIFFHTYEGQLDLGLYANQRATVHQEGQALYMFDFSLTDPEVVKAMEDAHEHRREVSLHYRQRLFVLPWHGETLYIIDHVEAVTRDTPPQ
jgi:hypothetical protein